MDNLTLVLAFTDSSLHIIFLYFRSPLFQLPQMSNSSSEDCQL